VKNKQLIPSPTIQSVFAAVQSGTADSGVVPFENSTNGSVVATLDLFADHQQTNPDVRVCGEVFVAVKHCLVGRYAHQRTHSSRSASLTLSRKRTWDANGAGAITTLYSHPQAWTQCTPFLTATLPHAERIDTSSTSKAAEIVAADATGASAAISSAQAAEAFGLDVLGPSIETVTGNTTRFLVIYRAGAAAEGVVRRPMTGKVGGVRNGEAADENHKCLVLLTIKHDDPGALARALAVFGRHGVNLTSINARPSLEHPWHYLFFVEFRGYYCPGDGKSSEKEEERRKDSGVYLAMRELEGSVETWKWCGCWKAGS